MKNLIKLINKSISKRTKYFWGTGLILSIILLIIFFSNSVIMINQERILSSKFSLYGSFHSIVYQDSIDVKNYNMSKYPHLDVIKENEYIIGAFFNNSQDFIIQNEEFSDLQDREAIITKSIAKNLNIKKDDTINLFNQNLKVKDIIKDFGYNWIHGEKEERNGITVPNIILNSKTFNKIINNDSMYRMIFLNQNDVNELDEKEISGNVYENKAISEGVSNFIYTYPTQYYVIQNIILIVLLVFILNTYRINSTNRYKVMNDLGMLNSNLFVLLIMEIVFISISALLFSFILNYIFSKIYINIMNIEYYDYNISKQFLNLRSYLAIYFLGIIITVFIFKKIFIKNNNKSMIISKFKNNKKIQIIKGNSYILLFSIMILFTVYMSFSVYCSLEEIKYYNTEFELYGQVKKNYDFQINYHRENIPYGYYLKNKEFVKINEDDLQEQENITEFYYYEDGKKLDTVFESLNRHSNIIKVDKFHENYYTYISIPKEVAENDFIQIFNNDLINIDLDFWKTYGIKENDYLTKAHLIAMPDNILISLLSDLSFKGDYNSLLDGETAILVSPSIYLKSFNIDGNGQKEYMWEFKDSGDNLIKDNKLSTYKNLELFIPQNNETVAGMINDKILNNLKVEIKHLTIPILEKTYKNIGWLDVDSSSPAGYRLLVSDKYLQKNHLNNEATRLHVFIKDYNRVNEIESEIYKLTANIDNLIVTNLSNQLEELHNFESLKNLIIFLFIILVLCIIIFSTIGMLDVYWNVNRENFLLYSDLGMTKTSLFKVNIMRVIKSILIGFVANILLFMTVYPKIGYIFTRINMVVKLLILIVPFVCALIFSSIFILRRVNNAL